RFVEQLAEEVERLVKQAPINPSNFDPRMDKQPGAKSKGGLARQFPGLGERDELSQHVAVREVAAFCLEEPLRESMLALVLGVVAEKAGRIEEHYLPSGGG